MHSTYILWIKKIPLYKKSINHLLIFTCTSAFLGVFWVPRQPKSTWSPELYTRVYLLGFPGMNTFQDRPLCLKSLDYSFLCLNTFQNGLLCLHSLWSGFANSSRPSTDTWFSFLFWFLSSCKTKITFKLLYYTHLWVTKPASYSFWAYSNPHT